MPEYAGSGVAGGQAAAWGKDWSPTGSSWPRPGGEGSGRPSRSRTAAAGWLGSGFSFWSRCWSRVSSPCSLALFQPVRADVLGWAAWMWIFPRAPGRSCGRRMTCGCPVRPAGGVGAAVHPLALEAGFDPSAVFLPPPPGGFALWPWASGWAVHAGVRWMGRRGGWGPPAAGRARAVPGIICAWGVICSWGSSVPAGDQGHVVLSVLTSVAEIIDHGAHQVDAQAAGRPLFQGGCEGWTGGVPGWG